MRTDFEYEFFGFRRKPVWSPTNETIVYTLNCFVFNASVNSSCAHPPPPGQLRGICVPCQSWGWGISKSGTAWGSGICLPLGLWHTRGFRLEIQTWRILSQRTSSSSQIGSSVKDWTNVWRFSRFYAFLHCLSGHNYLTIRLWARDFTHRNRERII